MNSLLNYIVTITLVIISGSIFFVEYLYPISYIIVILLFMIFNILIKDRKINYYDVLWIILFLILNIVTIIVTNDKGFYTYVGFAVSLFISFLASRIISKDEFISVFSKIITILSFVSVLFFVFGLVYPDFIVENFMFIQGKAGTDYYNAVIHVYQYSENASVMFNRNYIDPRNASVFWEPGVFQAFININIYFLISRKDCLKKYNFIVVAINIVALATTLSIAGYFILFLILMNYSRTFFKDIRDVYIVSFLFFILLTGLLSLGYLDFFVSRVLDYGDNFKDFFNSVLKRTYIQNIMIYRERINYLPFGLGYSHPRLGNANSLVELVITNGLALFSLILFYFSYKIRKNFRSGMLFLIFLLIFVTEPLLQKPFFLFFLFLREDK